MKKLSEFSARVLLAIIPLSISGCWLAAAGVGAETGYVVAQEDRSVGETIDDQGIVAAVKTKLLADPDVSGLDINVDSFKGTVTLKGVVESSKEVRQAIALAQSVDGVKSVQSKLFVE